ncbi:MAG: 23S rRNA (uracil(1939)-C(5))-methyltransferase RlmD [Peptococcaceae bacterium]|nr:23S rRNA (uracil(1939)-C(5))-methyltransferase RlmD [Peptococcaceae bacterium]
MQIQCEITGLSHDGAGVGRVDGKVVFVPGALPGETVLITPGQSKKGVTQASLDAVLSPSAQRVTPPCAQAARCGGCALQIADAALQAQLKTAQVRDAMARIAKLNVDVREIRSMDEPWRYRNKGIFHADYASGRTRLGFFEKGSHELVPAADCLLFSTQVNALAAWLEDAITATGTSGGITKVMIRESHANGEMMVVFVTSAQKFRQQTLVDRLQSEWPQVVSIWHNVNTNPRLMLGRAYTLLAGKSTIRESLGACHYELSPASFFQVNTVQAEVLYQCGKDLLPDLAPDATILDLYCGIGTIGSFIAAPGQRLIGVDSVGQAIDDAKQAARANVLANAHFYTAKAEQWLPKWLAKGNHADLAIIDPPRKGCDHKLLDALITAHIPHILYISCNPATLARDLTHLAPHYTISPLQPVDLFPQTSHTESVVGLERKG